MGHLLVDFEPLETAEEPLHLHVGHPMTREQYAAFCAVNRDVRIERTASGEIIIMAPAHSRTGFQNSEITGQLRAWANADGRGLAFDSSAGFDLPNGANLGPDAAWVLKSRLADLTEEQKQYFLPLSPDFVIELRSKSDRLSTVKSKMQEYIDNGTRLGWLIDPLERTVHVYRPNRDQELILAPDAMSGDPELPGFVLDLKSVWEPGF